MIPTRAAGARSRLHRKNGNTKLMNTSKSHNNKTQQPRNKYNKRRGQRTHANALTSPAGVTTLAIPRSVGFVMPDRLRTGLKYWQSSAINLSVVSSGSLRYQPSAAFDIDPTVGGATMAGFNEMSALYRSYRVKSSRIKVEIANTSPDSIVNCAIVPTNADPGSAPSSATIIAARQQPYANVKTCPPLGGPMTVLVSTMSTKKIFGNPMTDFDDNFASLVTTIPNNNWFWFISVYSLATIPSTDPVLLNVFIDVEIEFYDRAFLP